VYPVHSLRLRFGMDLVVQLEPKALDRCFAASISCSKKITQGSLP
jgi:hypothetical protein